MTLQVSQDLVKPVIEAKIQAAIVAELMRQDQGGLMAAVVGNALTLKVNSEGKVDSYSGYNTGTYIEWLCREAVRKSARAAMETWLQKNGDTIQKHIEREFAKHSKTLAASFVEGLLGSIKSQWQLKVDVAFQSSKD